MGEVGRAVAECLGDNNKALHICFPYSSSFIDDVRGYQRGDELTIIHSTVPVGTTAQIPNAVHAPIRGQHPHLVKGIRTFTMYVGGALAEEAKPILVAMGAPCVVTTPDSRTTEALKLWDTTQYGWNIILQKAIKRYCDVHGLDYGLVYVHANYSYNLGYGELGHHQSARAMLEDMPGPIGGHCVIPNCELLDDDIASYILEYNENLRNG